MVGDIKILQKNFALYCLPHDRGKVNPEYILKAYFHASWVPNRA
jgi:hypothetical protein